VTGTHVLLDRLDLLAADVGRLRRRLEPESSIAHLGDRLADHVETLDVILSPSAAELQRAFFCECGDHDLALDEALAETDRRQRQLRVLLSEPLDRYYMPVRWPNMKAAA
jgi:hypothetical protein